MPAIPLKIVIVALKGDKSSSTILYELLHGPSLDSGRLDCDEAPKKLPVSRDGGVGKSSCTLRFISRDFSEDYDPTIEDSYTTTVTVDGQEYSIELLDTAGQEDYHSSFGETGVRDGDAFVCVYSIDRKESFDLLPRFLHRIRKVKWADFDSDEETNPSSDWTPENTPFCFMILGNKADITARAVPPKTGLDFARQGGGLFCECSAKTRANIDTAFTTIVRAAAKTKRAREEYYRRRATLERFSGNVAVLEKAGQAGATFAPDLEKRSRNNKLALDRNRTMDRTRSLGGLAEPEQKNGCGCLIV